MAGCRVIRALAIVLLAALAGCMTPPGMTLVEYDAQKRDAQRWRACIAAGGTPVRLHPPTGPYWPDAWMCE